MGSRPDWHPEDIKAAIRKKGVSLDELSRRNGYNKVACKVALRKRWPAVERLIGEFLGLTPQAIWPSRYHADGTPIRHRNRAKDTNKSRSRIDQKSSAA